MRSRAALGLVERPDHNLELKSDLGLHEHLSRHGRRLRPISRPLVSGTVAALDGVIIVAAGCAASLASPPADDVGLVIVGLATVLAAVLGVNLLHLLKAYRFDNATGLVASVQRIAAVWIAIVCVIVGFVLLTLTDAASLDPWLGQWAVSGLLLLILSRVVLKLLARRWNAADRLSRNCALIGTGPLARQVLQRFDRDGSADMNIVGVFEDRDDRGPGRSLGHAVQPLDDLIDRVREGRVDGVIVAVPVAEQGRIADIVHRFHGFAVDVFLCLDEAGPHVGAHAACRVADTTLLNVAERPLRDWCWVVKGVEDRVLAALLLAAISPFLMLFALAIKFDSSGPVLFRQKRLGLNNELIEVFKFRSMYHHARDVNCEQQTQRDDPRVTRVGRCLRRASLDELPQLFNVLFGQMSLVGPRPHALATKAEGVFFEDTVRHYAARHRVKPGITGWAQVNGWRGETQNMEQIRKRIECDLYYIKNWSLSLDVAILLRTLRCGFTGRQAY